MAKTIITLGREYCTGGRYIAEDVANALGIKLYDKELITMAAKNSGLSEEAVAASEKRHTHSLLYSLYTMGNDLPLGDQVFILQSRIIKQLADEGPCVIVGRCADVILKDYHPLNLFVYANAESKIQRCIDRAPEGEHLSRNDIARRMKQVDKNRAQYRQMFADSKWGAKETYHLCVNTSGHQIKDLIPGLAAFVRCWYGEK